MHSDILEENPEIVLAPTATLRDAIEAMTRCRISIALVVGKGRRLLGIVNDIDIRKCLLRGGVMETPVAQAMNRKPITVQSTLSDAQIAEAFRAHRKAHIPIVDRNRRLTGLADLKDYSTIQPHYPNWVVIMAGGQGQRLTPLTKSKPKPMLPLGNKPILEVLMEQFKSSGFDRFMFTVNHLAEQITSYFGDGSRWGVRIEYLREAQPLGTVGGLNLIKRPIHEPLLVANGDILTKVNFGALLEFHKTEKAAATLCVKQHETHVPYGVVEIAGYRLQSFVEKPTRRTYINAGIYVLEPEVLSWLPRGKRSDMPDLIAEIGKHRKKGVACFPIQEYWMDIGEIQAYQRAAGDYNQLFE